MFFSITNLFTVQIRNPYTGCAMSWLPLEDEDQVRAYIKKWNWPYRVATVFNGGVYIVTYRYCERMLWGFDGFGVGLKR